VIDFSVKWLYSVVVKWPGHELDKICFAVEVYIFADKQMVVELQNELINQISRACPRRLHLRIVLWCHKHLDHQLPPYRFVLDPFTFHV
jgi:hypothetical protein